MVALNRGLADLSDVDRQELEAWLVAFDQQWGDGALPERARRLPSPSSWRLPALCEMVKIDLERQWARGNRLGLETYLKEYPELGNPSDVSADLIQAEYDVRRQFGAAANLDDYARRFPAQIDELRRRISSGRSSLALWPMASATNNKTGTRKRAPTDTIQELPEQFGRYRILNRLGVGGMGSVYLAEDTRLKRKVALKVAHVGRPGSREVLERFYREAEAAAGLDHPYLCKIFDVGEVENVHYLTMEYVEGTTLADFVAGRKDLSARQVAAIVGKLALALQEAHAKGVVHRDLKPANVMIRKTGQKAPVIVDFGLAQQLNTGGMRLTQTGQAMGTPYYMATEQVKGDLDAIGPACDIYALGVILYELLTGVVPFDGPNPMVVVAQILTTRAAPPSKHRPDLDPKLEAICLKAMAREIKDRYASMAELAAALSDYIKAPKGAPGTTGGGLAAPPAAGSSRQQGSDTLMGRFFEKLVHENDAAPIIDPNAKPVVPALPQPEAEGKGPRRLQRILTAAAAGFVVLLLGVVIYVATDKGRIKITVDGPKLAIKVDGEEVRIDDLDEPITLRAGDHNLTVIRGKTETETRKFLVHRGHNEDVRIDYEPKASDKANASQGAGPGAGAVPENLARLAPGSIHGPMADKPPGSPAAPPGSVTNTRGMTLKLVPAGTFLMGASDDPGNEHRYLERADLASPRHKVRITRPFYLGAHEVTQADYLKVMGYNPSGHKATPKLPVDSVSWFDAIDFCNKLSVKEGLAPYYKVEGQSVTVLGGDGYRLPTEAEWEYGSRGGTQTLYAHGNDGRRMEAFGWVRSNSEMKTHPVGEKLPNGFGLHDMSGNVAEWCWDWRATYPDDKGAVAEDPTGSASGTYRVVRGGHIFNGTLLYCSPWDRAWDQDVNSHEGTIGFRVARSVGSAAVSSAEGKSAGEERDDNGLKMRFCWCPPGTFRMGSPADEPEREKDEGPVNVTLSQGFWMGQFEVTQSQWQSIMGTTLEAERAKAGGEKLHGAGPDHPMYYVNHTQAEEFCVKFTESERRAGRLPAGWSYRLPTEAQWEYACRAGTTTATTFGDRLSSADANFVGGSPYNGAPPGPYLDKTTPVGRYRPNKWGIYDMHGNVWEWCRDGTAGLSFFDHVEPLTGGVDPLGPGSAPGRVIRGGSWRIPGRDLRSAFRLPRPRDFRYSDLGFRVARVPSVEGGEKGEDEGSGSSTSAGETGKPLVDKPPVPPAAPNDLPRSAPDPLPSKAPDPVLTQFRPLFNGKNSTGWIVDTGLKSAWRVDRGELVVTGPGNYAEYGGFLLNDRDLVGDFHLRFEFQPGPGANSGVTFRAVPGDFAGRFPHPLQIELFDRDGPVLKNGTFFWSTPFRNVVDALPPDRPAELKPPGSWNTMEVEVQGDILRVAVNEKEILRTNLAQLAGRPDAQVALTRKAGRIGFQSNSGTVRFRNIEVKEFEITKAPVPVLTPKASEPIRVLVITGDDLHDWKATTEKFREILGDPSRFKMDITETPGRDLTDANLSKYDVLVLNYRDTPKGGADTRWSETNKAAFLRAVRDGGKGLYVHHFASGAFTAPNWDEFEKAIAGGFRSQGFHGPPHEFFVKKTNAYASITQDLPARFTQSKGVPARRGTRRSRTTQDPPDRFMHFRDELYSNSLRTPDSVVLATAYSDPTQPKGTGKDEPVIWTDHFGKGRVVNNVLGHDVFAMSDPNYQSWVRRCIEWASGLRGNAIHRAEKE